MVNRFSAAARVVVTSAVGEAQRRGERRVGTEHLLLGLLHGPTSPAVAALGVDLPAARAALHAMDAEALASLGVDAGGLLDATPPAPPTRGGHPRFTSAAKAVLQRTLHEAVRAHDRRLEPRHLLLALLGCERPDPAAELLARLDVHPHEVRARLDRAA